MIIRFHLIFNFGRDYNPEEGRGKKDPISREVAMQELIQVVKTKNLSLLFTFSSYFASYFALTITPIN